MSTCSSNPTQRVAERKLAALEGAQEGLLFSSGMAAITTTLFAMLSKGAHVVVTDDGYRALSRFPYAPFEEGTFSW